MGFFCMAGMSSPVRIDRTLDMSSRRLFSLGTVSNLLSEQGSHSRIRETVWNPSEDSFGRLRSAAVGVQLVAGF
jgi:hypothetical protein